MTLTRSSPAPQPVRPVRTVVIDDVASIRTTLRRFLDAGTGIHVVGEADNATDGSTLVAAMQPDLVLVDLNLGDGLSGQELVPVLRERFPSMWIVVVSAYADPVIQREVLGLGADLFVPKQDIAQVVRAVREIAGLMKGAATDGATAE